MTNYIPNYEDNQPENESDCLNCKLASGCNEYATHKNNCKKYLPGEPGKGQELDTIHCGNCNKEDEGINLMDDDRLDYGLCADCIPVMIDADEKEVYIVMISSGYDWNCPRCDHLNNEISVNKYAICDSCNGKYNTEHPEHAHS